MKQEFYVIAHNIRSLYNVGSIFRSCDAFGATKLYLTGYTGTPKNPRLAKTSLGAELTVPWEYHKQLKPLIKKLKSHGVVIVGLENKVTPTIPLQKFKSQKPVALILGEEVNGIKYSYLNLCEKIIEIPMHGIKESLNVSVAFGIAAYHISHL